MNELQRLYLAFFLIALLFTFIGVAIGYKLGESVAMAYYMPLVEKCASIMPFY